MSLVDIEGPWTLAQIEAALQIEALSPAEQRATLAAAQQKQAAEDSLRAFVEQAWDVLEPGIAQDMEKGILDQQRGLCYWALGQFDEARAWFRRALQLDHSNDVARTRLVDAYFSKKDYAAVVSLFSDAGVTETTDSETLLRIATSMEKRGNAPEAISILEKALLSRPEEGPFYLALAQYYTEIGNPQKAADLTEKGKSLLVEDPAKP